MNKKWLLSMALLAIVVPALRLCAMEAEAVYDSEDLAQEIENASFLERIQVDEFLSPDGLLVARCTYLKKDRFRALRPYFVQKEELEKYGRWGYYPWQCHIAICMAADGKVVGNISAADTTLHRAKWLDGNRLRILAATLTGVKQLQWFDCVYALDGTWLNNSMDDRLRMLYRAASTPPAQ